MKSLIFLVSLIVAASYAHAAELELTTTLKDRGLAKIQQLHQRLAETFEHDQLGLESHAALIVSRKASEKADKTVKQLLYKIYTEWSRPDEVEVFAVTDAGEVRGVLATSVSALEESDKADVAPASAFIRESLKILATPRYRVFAHTSGNSFGNCTGAALESLATKELLILSSCYSE